MAFYLTAKEIRGIFKKLSCPQCRSDFSRCTNKRAFCDSCGFVRNLSHMTQWDIIDHLPRKNILAILNLENYPLNAMRQPLHELPMSRIPEDAHKIIQTHMESDDYEE